MLSTQLILPILLWASTAAYLAVAALVVAGTDFRAPRENFGAHLVICVVALMFAAAWPFRARRRVIDPEI
jgi:hypothetical protein